MNDTSDGSRGSQVAARRMTLRLPDDAWAALDSLAPEGERGTLIAYLLRCELKRQGLDVRTEVAA